MIWLIFVETALELVPPELHKHPAITSQAKKRGKKPSQVLLNTAFHHSAMGSLHDAKKRGRPDILHLCLLSVLNTPLARIHGCLNVAVHLKYPVDRVITIDPDVNLPRASNRFEGLMSKLLETAGKKGIDGKNPFFDIKEITLEKFLEKFDRGSIHALSRSGSSKTFLEVLERVDSSSCEKTEDLVILVGGFQAGNFSKNTLELVPQANVHSISEMPLDAWTVAARVVHLLEMQVDKTING